MAELKLPRGWDPARADEILQQARPALNLPAGAVLHVENVNSSSRGTEIRFSGSTTAPLTGPDLGAASGILVDVSGHGALEFDGQGSLVQAQFRPDDPHRLEAIRANVRQLVASAQIYFPGAGEKIDPGRLRAQGKPWYIETDAQGDRRLKRAYIG